MLRAPINKILPYSVVDGPGNRAVVFFQKCNLNCVYCHNPETQQLCLDCGECVSACPTGALSLKDNKIIWDNTKCCACDTCIKRCPHHASPKVSSMTPNEIFEKVKESLPFIRGITASGGECSLYPDFLQELFSLSKAEGLSCLMDCNGVVKLSDHPDLMAVCDGVMLDVKAWNKACFQHLTGSGNHPVKDNLLYLSQTGKLAEVRIVVLLAWVDAEAVIDGIAQTLGNADIQNLPLKLIRFRHFGVRGALENTPSPSLDFMQTLEQHAMEAGFEKVFIL